MMAPTVLDWCDISTAHPKWIEYLGWAISLPFIVAIGQLLNAEQ